MNTSDLVRGLIAYGLSQTEISRRTGVPQPRLSRWARGEAPVGADDALRLAALLAEIKPQGAEPAQPAAADTPPPAAQAQAQAHAVGG